MDQTGTVAVVNRQAGTVRSLGQDAVHALIAKALGPQARIELLAGAGIEPRIRQLLQEGKVTRLIVGGGDGTVASAAGLVAGTGVALGVLPLGTMNLVAQTLGMAPDLATALAQIEAAKVRSVDAARANGRLFLHHVSFGLQPRMVRLRERLGYSSRLTKIMAAVRASLLVIFKPRSRRLHLRVDGADIELRTPGLIISNNVYEDAMMLKQRRLDEGVLGIYALDPMPMLSYLRLAFDVWRGRWRDNENVRELQAHRVTLDRPRRFGRRRRSIAATIDGELTLFDLPLEVASAPAALRMLVPPTGPA